MVVRKKEGNHGCSNSVVCRFRKRVLCVIFLWQKQFPDEQPEQEAEEEEGEEKKDSFLAPPVKPICRGMHGNVDEEVQGILMFESFWWLNRMKYVP